MKFYCSCDGHMIEFNYDKDKDGLDSLFIAIYELYGKSRKLKKPKLKGDVVLSNWKTPENKPQLKKFLDYIKRIDNKHRKGLL